MPQDLTDDKSTLVQVMAWCRQATSQYLGQCWLSFLSPYGVARPQWVNRNGKEMYKMDIFHFDDVRQELFFQYIHEWNICDECSIFLSFFNLFMATTGGVWIIPYFQIWGLCTACWAHFMCHHKLWPTLVGHPFSFLNSSWGLTGGKHYQKISIAILRFFIQNFVNSRLLSLYSFLSLSFLLTFFRLICYCSMWVYFSQGVVVSNDKST